MNPDLIMWMAKYVDFRYSPGNDDFKALTRFAEMVAEHEREACAKLVETAGADGFGTLAIAAAIRSRG